MYEKTSTVWNVESGFGDSSFGVGTFSPDGTKLAIGACFPANWIKVWNLDDGEIVMTLEGHSNNVTSVRYSPDGSIIASGSWDKSVKLWNAETEDYSAHLRDILVMCSVSHFLQTAKLLFQDLLK